MAAWEASRSRSTSTASTATNRTNNALGREELTRRSSGGDPAGVPLSVRSPVYQVMNGGRFPAASSRGNAALTLEHLSTMSSGLDCETQTELTGAEDVVTQQTDEPDWWKVTVGLKMMREPGERAVYCSVNPILIGGVMRRAGRGVRCRSCSTRSSMSPLAIRRYWMNLTPTGDAFMGGGVRSCAGLHEARELMMNGATWAGGGSSARSRRSIRDDVCRSLGSSELWISVAGMEYLVPGRA